MLVTALETNATVPTMDVICLLHEERKRKEKEEGTLDEKTMEHCLESSTENVSIIIVGRVGRLFQ